MTTKRVSGIFLGFVIAIGMMLTSCSKDVNGIKDGDGDNLESGYFALKIRTGAATKAFDPNEEGEPEESEVTTIRVVLYNPNPNANKVAYSWDFSTDKTDTNGDGKYLLDKTSTNYITIAQEVAKQAYSLLVIINPTEAAKDATEKGDFYSEYAEAQYDLTPADLIGPDKNYFMMSNFAGLVNVTVDDIYDTQDEAHATGAPVQVLVERAVAKIIVDGDFDQPVNQPITRSLGNNTYNNDAYSVKLLGWAADVTNKWTYWTRKQAPMLGGAAETGDPLDREIMYAIDPNYENMRTGSVTLSDHFNYIGSAGVPGNNMGSYEYVLENTMTAAEQWTDVTTRVIIKASYYPSYSTIDHDVLLSDGDSYYVYKNFIFTPSQLELIHLDTYPDWDNIVIQNTVLADLQDFLQTSASQFNNDYDNNGLSVSKIVGDLQFNIDGINYYPVLIRHFTGELTNMAYGRYGVVRNNVYKLNVKSISGPGKAIIPGGGPDPDPKPDDDFGFVSVDIKILPWYVRLQPVDL